MIRRIITSALKVRFRINAPITDKGTTITLNQIGLFFSGEALHYQSSLQVKPSGYPTKSPTQQMVGRMRWQ